MALWVVLLLDATRGLEVQDLKIADQVIEATLESGEKIKISGFGNFVVRDKKDRMGRDPQRAVPILIPARRVLTFKPSQVLKNILNGLPPV